MGKAGPERTVSNDRVLLEFILSSDPAYFTSELAENLPLSRQAIRDRLEELEDEGCVRSKLASGRRLWWITDKGNERVARIAREKLT